MVVDRRLRTLAAIGAASLAASLAAAQEPVGTVQQPLIGGTLVDNDIQRDRGLVTVGGGCSGTLLNQYWVLTADHCLSTNGLPGGPAASFASRSISAVWSPAVVTPTRFVRNWAASGRDVALIFLGDGDFGPVAQKLIRFRELEPGMAVVKYGRGISAYASAGTPPTPAFRDGLYRSATFTVASVSSDTYRLDANSVQQVGAGGDSGGPDWTVGPGNVLVDIAGVTSSCTVQHLAGQPPTWDWVTNVSGCNSALLWDIRPELVAITSPQRVEFCGAYAAKAVAAANFNTRHGCGFSGPRWSPSELDHLDWCMGLNGDEARANAEADARSAALGTCPVITEERPLVTSPAVAEATRSARLEEIAELPIQQSAEVPAEVTRSAEASRAADAPRAGIGDQPIVQAAPTSERMAGLGPLTLLCRGGAPYTSARFGQVPNDPGRELHVLYIRRSQTPARADGSGLAPGECAHLDRVAERDLEYFRVEVALGADTLTRLIDHLADPGRYARFALRRDPTGWFDVVEHEEWTPAPNGAVVPPLVATPATPASPPPPVTPATPATTVTPATPARPSQVDPSAPATPSSPPLPQRGRTQVLQPRQTDVIRAPATPPASGSRRDVAPRTEPRE